MNPDDDFRRAADIIGHSRLAEAAAHVIEIFRAQAATAATFALVRRGIGAFAAAPRGERVRLIGILLLVAILTQATVLQWSPPMAKPSPPTLLRLELIALAIAMIVLARPLADMWNSSRVSRMLGNARASDTPSTRA